MTSTTNESTDSFFDGRWLREATEAENQFDENQKKGIYSLCYSLRLKSKSPLEEDHVRSALTHLYRKCVSLNFCFGYRDGSKWIKRTTNPNVDFKVINDKVLEEVRNDLLNYRYNWETGPIFCTRLMRNVTDSLEPSGDPETLAFHTSYLLFGLHHGIGDGTAIIHILGFFISLLNDVISGNPICDDEPLGKIAGTEYVEEELEKKRELLRNDPALRAEISQEIATFVKDLAYIKTGFPTSKGERETQIEEYVLDQKATAKFFKRCKQEGVSVNSGFSAAANVALTDLLIENGVVMDFYTLKTYTAVNLRRYSKTDISHSLGIHFGHPLAIKSLVPGKINSQFWQYARSLHEELSHSIKSGKCLLNQAHSTLSNQEATPEYLSDDKSTFSDFAISNMGEVTHILSEGREEVRPTHFFRYLTLHEVDTCPITMLCHTFRGKFTFTINYNAAVVDNGVMKRFCKQIVKRMQSVP